MENCFLSLEVEGDCLPLIQQLQKEVADNNFLGFTIHDILDVLKSLFSFPFCSLKGDNKVAHDLASSLATV